MDHEVTIEKNIAVTVRDGTRLSTDLHIPSDARPSHVVLPVLPAE